MPYNILITEKQNKSQNEIVYVKASEVGDILKVDSSLRPPKKPLYYFKKILYEIFLPREFPTSVSKDYVSYQIWDTIQASCSTISNTLVTKTILEGLGVGDNTATSAGATITWILKEGTGKLAGILFAWFSSSGLDAQCKKWRLFADVLNDIATLIELTLLPIYPSVSLRILCISTSMKAVVGVAGGATRAAITQHQAIKQNMADVSAKDGSQETCVNLIASLLSAVFLLTVVNTSMLWYLFLLMTFLHLYANYKAVKSLNFNTFNRERLLLVIQEYLSREIILPPIEINRRESVYLGFGLSDIKLCGFKIKSGHSFEKLMKNVCPFEIQLLTHMFKDRKYIIFIVAKKKTIHILLHHEHTCTDLIEAYYHAVLFAIGTSYLYNTDLELLKGRHPNEHCLISKLKNDLISSKTNFLSGCQTSGSEVLMFIDQFASHGVQNFLKTLSKSGWDLERHLLEVKEWRAKWAEKVVLNESKLGKKIV
uniref:Putative conserved plasma membrane protein n=1 Tax=Triatoma infestans TaxID=30076 RepID=A0A023F0A2_TRIIF